MLAFMNLVETFLNFLYLWMASRPVPERQMGIANLVGFTAAALTVAKTILYWLVEFFSGMQHTGHNTLTTYFFVWVVCIPLMVYI